MSRINLQAERRLLLRRAALLCARLQETCREIQPEIGQAAQPILTALNEQAGAFGAYLSVRLDGEVSPGLPREHLQVEPPAPADAAVLPEFQPAPFAVIEPFPQVPRDES